MDFAIEGIRKRAAETPQSAWAVADGEQLPLPDVCMDYVTHVGSLEHYISPERGVKEVARVLKPTGKACVLVPNAYGLLGNIGHVWRKGEIYDDGQPLQRYATRHTWEKLLEENGLRINRTLGYGEVDLPQTLPDALWLLARPHKLIRYLLTPLIPVNLTNDFVFICVRA
jgi:SAM-dependent methyltransferase